MSLFGWFRTNFTCRNQTIKKVSLLKSVHPFTQMKHCDIHEMTRSKQSWTWLHMYLQLQGSPIWVECWPALAKCLLWDRGSQEHHPQPTAVAPMLVMEAKQEYWSSPKLPCGLPFLYPCLKPSPLQNSVPLHIFSHSQSQPHSKVTSWSS